MATSLYKDTAKYYAGYRPPYPKAFIDLLRDQNLLLKEGRLLDIGCGTGQLAILLSPYFKKIIGVDQENEMLVEAKRIVNELKIKNITWIESKAEQLSEALGNFDLITIGRALHWMNIDKLMPWVYSHLAPNGALITAGEKNSFWEGGEEWKRLLINIVNQYVGSGRIITNQNYFSQKDKIAYTSKLANYHFKSVNEFFFEENRTWNLESIIGFLYSTANCNKRLLGDKIKNFENEVSSVLLKSSPSGIFTEKVVFSFVVAKK